MFPGKESNSVFIFLESSLYFQLFLKPIMTKTKTLICRNYEVISLLLEHCNVLCLVMDSVTKAIGTLRGYFPPTKSKSLFFFLVPIILCIQCRKHRQGEKGASHL